jgi:hypothetical protein
VSISNLTLRLVVVLSVVSGCSLWDKSDTTVNYSDCFAQAGSGLPTGWVFDSTHWACESSPISLSFEVANSTFPYATTATATAWNNGVTPWNAATADITISAVTGYLTVSDDDNHNAVYYVVNDHHPSQIGWLGATLCHATGSSPEASNCDTRIFDRFLTQLDDPNLPGDQKVTTPISWTDSNTTSSNEYRLPMAFAHEMAHAVGFGHNDGVGSITETLVPPDVGAPSTLASVDENALQWVYGQ